MLGCRKSVTPCHVHCYRAVGAPWNVNTDNQDAFSVRDVGFLQMYCEDNQEIYDTVLMGYRIAENSQVYFPCAVNYDGYILSHTLMPVQIEDSEKVHEFFPALQSHINLSDVAHPKGVNPVTIPNLIARRGTNCCRVIWNFVIRCKKRRKVF